MAHYHEMSIINTFNRGLLESSGDAVILIGSEGIILDVNKLTEKITGYQRDELIGTQFSRYCIDPDMAERDFYNFLADGTIHYDFRTHLPVRLIKKGITI